VTPEIRNSPALLGTGRHATLTDPVRACARRKFSSVYDYPVNGRLNNGSHSYLMQILRRWLASGALVLTVLQLALLFAVPVSACCASAGAARTDSIMAASDDAPDCCPPGAHPKGACPLHGGRKTTHCRLTCGHVSGPEFVLGAIGVLPAPSAVIVPFGVSAAPVAASAILPLRSSVPDAPPPRLL
jgi:hypothetical protein